MIKEFPVVRILGVKVHVITPEEALGFVADALKGSSFKRIITLNAEIAYGAVTDAKLTEVIEEADLVTPDGNGILWASGHYGTAISQRVCGIDLLQALLEEYKNGEAGFYFLGAKPEIATACCEKIKEQYPGLKYCGYRDGYFDKGKSKEIAEEIRNSGAEILVVAMGAPYQDLWIAEYGDITGAKVAIGVGGSLDVISGAVKRAPKAFQVLKAEWLYRLLKEPWRWKRMLNLPRFCIAVLRDIHRNQ